MKEAFINIGDKKFPLSYLLLKAIAENFPRSEQYKPLAKAILQLGIPSLTTKILDRNIFKDYGGATLWELADGGNRAQLLRKTFYAHGLTDAQAQDIIADNDERQLLRVAQNCRIIAKMEGIISNALSKDMAIKLLRHVALHAQARVRQTFFRHCGNMPWPFKPNFRECCTAGICPGAIDYASMRPFDIILLHSFSLPAIVDLAKNIHKIADISVLVTLGELLATHPDPAVRLALAKNRYLPVQILEMLTRDEDGDVAMQAKENLKNED